MAETNFSGEITVHESLTIDRARKVPEEILENDKKRTLFEKFIEKTVCAILGHDRHFSVWKGRYNPKYCKRYYKHIRLW